MVGNGFAAQSLRNPRIWGFAAISSGAIAGAAAAVAGPTFGLLPILGVVAAFAVARMPGVLLAAYLLIAVYKGAVQPYSPVDITLILALLNIVQIVPLVVDRRPLPVSRSAILLWVALAGLVLFGVLYAPDQNLAVSRAANFCALVFLPLPPAALRIGSDPKFVRQLLWTFFGVGGLVVTLGLAKLAASERLTVLEADTIDTARAALLVPLLGVAFVWRERPSLLRGIAIILIPAAMVVAIASGSRGPLLMLVVLGALATVRTVLKQRSADLRVMGLVAGVALVSVFVLSVAAPDLPAASTERIGALGQELASGLSGGASVSGQESRFHLYGLAISLFEEQPVIGTGTASYDALSPRYLGPQEAAAYPHNALLQFAAEYGLIGLALFVGIVLLALVRKQPPGSIWSALKWLFVFMLLNTMVSGNILEERAAWGLLLLLLVAAKVPRVGEATPSPVSPPWTSRG